MNKYKNAHIWVSVAFVIVILGFIRSYWSKFPNVSFEHHLHLLTATAWFAFLIWQPRLATTQRLDQHRRNGMIGLILAGMVTASAMLMMPANIQNAVDGVSNGFVSPAFFYGITFFDVITVLGFVVSVAMAMLRSKQLDNHAIWMLSTVYWIVAPAFARLMALPVIMIHGMEGLTFFKVIFMVTPIILVAIVVTMWRLKNWHPALILALIANALIYVSEYMGNAPWWQTFTQALFLNSGNT